MATLVKHLLADGREDDVERAVQWARLRVAEETGDYGPGEKAGTRKAKTRP